MRFIIDGEVLEAWESDVSQRAFDIAWQREQIAKIRSHPYNPQAEREKVLDKFADLIHNESVRLFPAIVDMVYSYRVAQIIVELRQGKDGE